MKNNIIPITDWRTINHLSIGNNPLYEMWWHKHYPGCNERLSMVNAKIRINRFISQDYAIRKKCSWGVRLVPVENIVNMLKMLYKKYNHFFLKHVIVKRMYYFKNKKRHCIFMVSIDKSCQSLLLQTKLAYTFDLVKLLEEIFKETEENKRMKVKEVRDLFELCMDFANNNEKKP